MKYLYANGDSWTHGTEIVDLDGYNSASTKYYNTWPWLLSQSLNIPICVNDAQGGASNIRIFRRTVDYINRWIGHRKRPEDLIVVVGWTTPERNEVAVDTAIYSITIQDYLRLHKIDVDEKLLKDYHSAFYNVYSDSYGEYMTAMYMTNLRMLCKGLGIKYYDFIAIGKHPAHWQEFIKTEWNLEIDNMYLKNSWSGSAYEDNWSRYQYGHPTIETHKLWADILAKEIK
jgi:hypothetical protein